MLSVAEAGLEQQGGDPGPAGVRAVRNLHATRELQALVKESGVKSCKDLEKMLRDGKPHNWSIIYSQGQAYLLRDPSVGKAEAPEDKQNPMDLSQERLSNEKEKSLNRGQAGPELQNLSQTEEPSISQEEDILLGVSPERRRPDYLRPEQSLGSDSVPDWEEVEESVFVGQDPHLTLGPAGSLRVKGAMLPQEDTLWMLHHCSPIFW